MAWVEKDHSAHPVPTPCYVQGRQPAAQAAQSHIQPGLECLQGWGIHSLLGQPVQCVTTLWGKNFLLISNLNLPCLSLRPFPIVTITVKHFVYLSQWELSLKHTFCLVITRMVLEHNTSGGCVWVGFGLGDLSGLLQPQRFYDSVILWFYDSMILWFYE